MLLLEVKMKYAFIFFLCLPAFADDCMNKIPLSSALMAIDEAQNGTVHSNKPGDNRMCTKDDPCVCFDGIEWKAATWDGQQLLNDAAKMTALALKRSQDKAAEDAKASAFADLKAKIKAGTATVADKDAFLKTIADKVQ
jgi:hypothetical protein